MTPEQTEIARRIAASPHFRWMPGMLAASANNYHRPARVESIDGDGYGLTVIPDADGPIFAAHHEWGVAGRFPRGCTVPDLSDPATVGCLHALACERRGATAITYSEWRGDTGDVRRLWHAVRTEDGNWIPADILSAFPDDPHAAAVCAALLHEETE